MKKEACISSKEFTMCPYVTAQRLLSGKWTILILQKLCEGPMRFNQLLKEIDVTQTTLTTQLKQMESDGLITRTVFAEVPVRVEYSLTEMGEAFGPVLDALKVWGDLYIEHLKQDQDSAM